MEKKAETKKKTDNMSEVKTNPLRNERIYVRFVGQKIRGSLFFV